MGSFANQVNWFVILHLINISKQQSQQSQQKYTYTTFPVPLVPSEAATHIRSLGVGAKRERATVVCICTGTFINIYFKSKKHKKG